MTDLPALLRDLRRPRLLVHAARFALSGYRRDRDLRRIMPEDGVTSPERVLHLLIDEESRLERIRREGCATYSFARHIDVLVAMLAELRLLPQSLA